MQALEVTASDKHSSKVIALTPTVSPARKRNMLRPSRCLDACVPSSTWKNRLTSSPRIHAGGGCQRRQASSKRGKQLSVNQPLTDSEARNIFINGAEDFYSLSANPQFSNVAELFDAWLTEHDRQLLAKTETEAGKRISSELKLEHASDAHARTEPSRAYIQGCKAARSLLEDAIRDMTQEQGTL